MDLKTQLILAQSGLNQVFTSPGSAPQYGLGDLLLELYSGSASDVASFNGRTGAVVSQAGDYTTSLVPEGSNLYFTNARTINATLTGYVSSPGTITSADSILSAIEKLNGNNVYYSSRRFNQFYSI
jgi:hypothetical protein